MKNGDFAVFMKKTGVNSKETWKNAFQAKVRGLKRDGVKTVGFTRNNVVDVNQHLADSSI